MVKKIVVIALEAYVTKRINTLYFEDQFLKDGFEFQYWSLIDLKIMRKVFPDATKRESNERVSYIKSYKELYKRLDEERDFYCFLQIPLNYNTFAVYKRLEQKAKGVYKFSYQEAFSSFAEESQKGFKKYFYKTPGELYRLLQAKVLLLYVEKTKFLDRMVVFSTSTAISSDIILNHSDYTIYDKIKDHPTLVAGDYIVFLDTYLVDHPDFKARGIETIRPNVYYRKMNDFFSKIEHTFGFKVVIAAHPRSDYHREFGNRKIIKNHTASLVNHCKFVVKHMSSSLTFAVYSRKPVVFIYTQEFLNEKSYLFHFYRMMSTLSELLGAHMLNIDTKTLETLESVDASKYNLLEEKYFCSKRDYKNYDIVKNTILKNGIVN